MVIELMLSSQTVEGKAEWTNWTLKKAKETKKFKMVYS